MTDFTLPDFDLDAFVRATLAEDLGAKGDITSMATIPADARFGGAMDSRDAITVAGLPIAERFFRALDPAMEIETLVGEGAKEAPGTAATLLDTRKTIQGLRVLENYATRMGGAKNHRMGLWDAAMIKDNHVAVAGSVEEAVGRAVAAGGGPINVRGGPPGAGRAPPPPAAPPPL